LASVFPPDHGDIEPLKVAQEYLKKGFAYYAIEFTSVDVITILVARHASRYDANGSAKRP
jgi:hypothetical protein